MAEHPTTETHTLERREFLTPVPDPTTLTTAQLLRELSSLREFLEARMDGHKGALAIRLDALDRMMTLLQAESNKIPQVIDLKIQSLEILDAEKLGSLQKQMEEKFNSVQVQFVERDTRTEQTTQAAKVAVDAALQAAKEAFGEQNRSSALAIAKSEAATMKQIDQLVTLFQTGTKALDDKIDDLKQWQSRNEGRGSGFASSWAMAVGIVGAIGIVFGIVMALVNVAHK